MGDLDSISGLGRSPGGGHDNPLQYSYLENPHGQRSLVGYSPWDGKEFDMAERLSAILYHCLYKQQDNKQHVVTGLDVKGKAWGKHHFAGCC